MISEPHITNALKSTLYAGAIDRFRSKLPPEMIRRLVDVTIGQELEIRKQAARARKAQDSKGVSSVVSSPAQ